MPRQISRWAFHTHLWVGVIGTVLLIVIAVTGVLLNHKRPLGLMPDVAHDPSAPFASALSLERIGAAAFEGVSAEARGTWKPGDPVDLARIERMDVRPRNGYAKVRFRDRRNTEATVDLASALRGRGYTVFSPGVYRSIPVQTFPPAVAMVAGVEISRTKPAS